jgi:ketosteroid isomerase-like protein
MEHEMESVEIAEALFEALAGRDDRAVRNLCSPNLRVRQNDGRAMDLGTLLAFNRAVGRVVKDFRYCDPVRSATATGFVEEHSVRGTLPGGKTLDLAVCVVADIKDGKVTDVREYFDSAAAAELVAALGS